MEFFRPVNSQVLQLMKASGAEFVSHDSSRDDEKSYNGHPLSRASGYYDCNLNKITITKEQLFIDVELVIFHELIHWTGHPERLNRPAVAMTFNGRAVSERQAFMEEAIADGGAIILGKRYGFNVDKKLEYYRGYQNVLKPHALLLVESQAMRAVNYLLNTLESRKAA